MNEENALFLYEWSLFLSWLGILFVDRNTSQVFERVSVQSRQTYQKSEFNQFHHLEFNMFWNCHHVHCISIRGTPSPASSGCLLKVDYIWCRRSEYFARSLKMPPDQSGIFSVFSNEWLNWCFVSHIKMKYKRSKLINTMKFSFRLVVRHNIIFIHKYLILWMKENEHSFEKRESSRRKIC